MCYLLPRPIELLFSVPGTPIPWARARRNGNRYFTDPKVAAYMEQIQWAAKAAGARPVELPCTVEIVAVFPIAPSWSKKKQADARAGALRHTSKPDYDNLNKIVGDALNGIAWKDDSQVYDGRCLKRYCDFLLKEPHLSVWVRYD